MAELDLEVLERLAAAATPAPWVVQDGCSWRRIGARGDGDVLCPTNHPGDGHPDLDGRNREADLAFIAAAREAVPALLRRVRELEAARAADQAEYMKASRAFRAAMMTADAAQAEVAEAKLAAAGLGYEDLHLADVIRDLERRIPKEVA